MNQSAITVRYAKALYQVAKESGKTDAVKEGVDLLNRTFKESPELNELLRSPIIKTSEKKKIFAKVFSGSIDEQLINFFNLIAKNRREQYLPNMCIYFLDIFKKEQGIKQAVITTALPVEEKHSKEILALLEKKLKLNIELVKQVNPDIIGGFKLRIDDQQVDASIASKLLKIKNELTNN